MSSVFPKEQQKVKYFDDIWNLIRKLSMITGIFVFPDFTKSIWMERILTCNPPLSFGIVLLFAYGTFKLDNFSLMSHILCDSILINYAAVFYAFSCIKRYNKDMIRFMDWCRSLYNYHAKFHSVQQKIAHRQVDWVHLWAIRTIKATAFVMWFDSLMISAGFAFVGQFLPESIYPKYSPPMPYYFPFEEQENWYVFAITLAGQVKCSLDLGSFHTLFLSIFYTISIHLYMYLNIIKETIELMGQQIEAKYDGQGLPQKVLKKKQPISNIVNTNILEDQNCDLPFREWIKLVVDMISESNEILSTFGEIFTGYFFLFELASFGSLFIFGMIMMVLHQQYFFAFGIVGASGILFSFCFINEQLMKKFAEISVALYEVPWYTLNPTERRFFMQVMTCSNIQKGFNSGIHGVTFERFNNIVQAAYSNVLVLKDLVMKS